MQIAGCQSDTICQIYLDLRKAYDSIARNQVPLLLEKYGVGPNIRRYIHDIWDIQIFVLQQDQFYSNALEVNRGCTQGDTDSPIIFNIIIDGVIRTWKNSTEFKQSDACFYTDDGLIQHHNHMDLQKDLDCILELFSKIGLKPNAKKTKFMIVRGAPAPCAKKRKEYNKMKCKRKTSSFVAPTRDWKNSKQHAMFVVKFSPMHL